jgi:hypothetical protein
VICEAFHTAKNNQTYGEREYPTIINVNKMNAKGLITFITILYYFYKRYQISSGKLWPVARVKGASGERVASECRVTRSSFSTFFLLLPTKSASSATS